jgi:Cu(I)-responsive transcriptional regulator
MAKVQTQMTIGALGEATSVNAETIRYYERIGILPAPARTAGGYRVYKPEHVRRLNFIRRGRELGLSLDAVRELLSLASDRLRPCTRVDRLVQEHIHDLDHKIEGLQQLRGALQNLADSCRGSTRVADCRILEALQDAEQTLAGPPVVCTDEVCVERRPAKSPSKSRKRG